MADVKIFVASVQDDRAAVERVLEEAGMTLDELRAEAEKEAFSSDEAALAWFRISHLVSAASEPAAAG